LILSRGGFRTLSTCDILGTEKTAMTQIGPTDGDAGKAWTAYILGELYTDWPRKRDFNALDVGVATELSPLADSENLFDDLLEWLKKNAYVDFSQAAEGAVFDVALTEKGFAVLGKRSSRRKCRSDRK
jgi:hypothetical protein